MFYWYFFISKTHKTDLKGIVYVFDDKFECRSFEPFQKNLLTLTPSRSNYLICVGNNGVNPRVQEMDRICVFNLNKYDHKANLFEITSTFPILPKSANLKFNQIASCLAVNDRLTFIALGLSNGTIILYEADFTKRKKNPNVRVVSPQPTSNDDTTPLTVNFLGFKPYSSIDVLFIVTSKNIFKFNVIPGLKKRIEPFFLETESEFIEHFGGGKRPCCTMSDITRDLIVGGKNGIWFYNETGRGSCVAFGGVKAHLHSFKDFLVVVSLEKKINEVIKVLTIYDVKHKLSVYKRDDRNIHYMYVLSQWNYIIGITKKEFYSMQLFKEVDIQSKVAILLEKKRFILAYQFVKPIDKVHAIKILKNYGDYEYKKKNYSVAMEQYIKTIGSDVVEPSYVIRKFLDAQKIDKLTKYLEVLHEKNIASPAHTTLLLNCYTKLKHKMTNEKLDDFIEKYSTLQYNVETAISVCRQANYIEHALKLAVQHKHHDWFVKIQIENKDNYIDALKHIESLSFEDAEENLKKYGKILISKIPKQTTNVLIRLCVNYFPYQKKTVDRKIHEDLYEVKKIKAGDEEYKKEYTINSSELKKSNPEFFIQSFSSLQFYLLIFLENVIFRVDFKVSESIINTIIELYLKNIEEDKKLVEYINAGEEERKKKVDNENLGVVEEKSEKKIEKKHDYDILFTNLEQEKPIREKLLMLLKKGKYNKEHVTFLVHSFNFSEGILQLYEKTNSYHEIIQHYMKEKDYENLLKSCRKYGKNDQNVWVEVLSFFAKNEDKDFNINNDTLEGLLNDENNLLPPLQIIHILSKNENTTLGTIKQYLIKKLDEDKKEIEEDEKKIKDMQEETKVMQKEIEELRTKSKIFQSHLCSHCNQNLKLPTVHFMCGHSYHDDCLRSLDGISDEKFDCKLCKEENEKVIETIKRFEESSEKVEPFFNQLSADPSKGFNTIAEYFGRAIFKNLDETNLLKKELEKKSKQFKTGKDEGPVRRKDLFE